MALSLACKSLPGTRGAGHPRHWEREEHHRLTRFYAISTLLKWYRASRPSPPVAHRQRRGHASLQHGVGDPRRFWARPQHRSTGGKGRVTTPMSFCIAIRGRRGDRSLYFGRVMVYHGPQGAW